MRPLTTEDKIHAFRLATQGYSQEGMSSWAALSEKGLNDDELTLVLAAKLGIFGGRGGPNHLHVTHQGAGLKIWASWEVHNHLELKPLFEGAATVAMARQAYGIPNPDNPQLSLF